jgi:hypothetical protein
MTYELSQINVHDMRTWLKGHQCTLNVMRRFVQGGLEPLHTGAGENCKIQMGWIRNRRAEHLGRSQQGTRRERGKENVVEA